MLKPIVVALRIVAWAMVVPAVLFLIAGLADVVQGAHEYRAVTEVTRITRPVVAVVKQYVPTRVRGYELAPWIIVALALVVRNVLRTQADRLDRYADYLAHKRALRRLATGMSPESAALKDLGTKLEAIKTASSEDRETLLRQYVEAKRRLEEAQKDLAFLSVDVIGSTKMKENEDAALIEYSFSEYKKFVNGILTANDVWKVAWTPDGIMCAFPSVDSAIRAARSVLVGLEDFNRSVKQVRADFAVRAGINAGKVMFDDHARMEEVSDHVIDVAGHMQKYARANTIWISAEALDAAAEKAGFVRIDRKVDDHDVFEWTVAASSRHTAPATVS